MFNMRVKELFTEEESIKYSRPNILAEFSAVCILK